MLRPTRRRLGSGHKPPECFARRAHCTPQDLPRRARRRASAAPQLARVLATASSPTVPGSDKTSVVEAMGVLTGEPLSVESMAPSGPPGDPVHTGSPKSGRV